MEIIISDQIQNKIYRIRGIDVMLDSDMAVLYGVETREVNQAVSRNLDKFPDDFMFELTADEFGNSNKRAKSRSSKKQRVDKREAFRRG